MTQPSKFLQYPGLRIDSGLLWKSLALMADVGRNERGGCNRQALTAEDKAGRDLFASWARAEGCAVSCDQIGNLFATRRGTEPAADPVLIGSHLDTQATGGKFDGVYGVLAGLEVIRTLNRERIQTRRPIEVVNWTNEEGCRFAPAMLGSGVACGPYSLDFAYSRVDGVGNALGEELARIGYRGERAPQGRRFRAAFEAHIEQGPILENDGITIGVVTGIQGAYWLDVTLTGQAAHAGPTPMESRRDPWRVACPIIEMAYDIAHRNGIWGRVTIGQVHASPGSRNTVPQSLTFSIDLRHPEAATLESMIDEFRDNARQIAALRNIGIEITQVWHMPPTEFDTELVTLVEHSATDLGFSHTRIVSGAGHDSLHTARIAPTTMIFVPCAGGLSHNEAESASAEDLAAGAKVLLHSVLQVANQ